MKNAGTKPEGLERERDEWSASDDAAGREAEELNTLLVKLHEASTLIARDDDLASPLQPVLDAVITATHAHFGNIQLLSQTGGLEIVAQRGFHTEFLDFFRAVHENQGTCGTSKSLGRRVIVEDVLSDPIFADEAMQGVMIRAGVRAVQSTPLIGKAGGFLGVISTHFRAPHRPNESELRFVDLFARLASDFIEFRSVRAERQRADDATRAAEARLRAVVTSATDAIITIDVEQKIRLFNAGAEAIFGYSADQMIGRSLDQLLPERFRGIHRGHVDTFGRTGVSVREMGGERVLTGLRRDGDEFPIEARISQVEVEGQKLYTVILRDITERQRAEAEREELRARAERAAKALEASNRAKDEFLAMLGHELRNPLSALRNAVAVASLDGSRRPAALEIAQRQADQLARLLDDLLDVARITQGRVTLRRERL
jgi:PAS domain S-box-containing protein